jgi:hypothetical protein
VIISKKSRELNQKYYDLMSERGKSLVKQHPELMDDVEWYLKNQQEECRILDRYITGAIWLLRKANWLEYNMFYKRKITDHLII